MHAYTTIPNSAIILQCTNPRRWRIRILSSIASFCPLLATHLLLLLLLLLLLTLTLPFCCNKLYCIHVVVETFSAATIFHITKTTLVFIWHSTVMRLTIPMMKHRNPYNVLPTVFLIGGRATKCAFERSQFCHVSRLRRRNKWSSRRVASCLANLASIACSLYRRKKSLHRNTDKA